MRISCALLLFILISCDTPKDPITSALSFDNEKIKRVFDNLEQHEIQILFIEIKRDQNNKVLFVDHGFRVDDSLYSYPASTVKLPVAILALEKLNGEENLNRNSKFYIEGDSLETTFAKEIEKIFCNEIPFLTTNKWKLGHAFAASGMLNIELAVLMLQYQKAIEVPFVEKQKQPKQLKKILVNTVGFGGNAVSVLLSK